MSEEQPCTVLGVLKLMFCISDSYMYRGKKHQHRETYRKKEEMVFQMLL